MRALLDAVAPVRCAGCGAPVGEDLCERCAQAVRVIVPPLCERCGAPGTATAPCPSCRTLGGFARARSLVVFAEPARSVTLALKRRAPRPLSSGMGTLLAELTQAWSMIPDAVAFVPGGRRARRTGFDHTALLASAVADRLGVPLRRVLRRAAEGPRQSDVGLSDRRTNVAGRFASRPVRGRVLLVDDVYTTGATAEACALALLGSGASSVDVVTWARTLLRRSRSEVR